MLQLADRLLGLRMLSATASTWLLRKSGSWRLTAISVSAWILPSMRSSSMRDELGVLLRASEVVEPQLRRSRCCRAASGRSARRRRPGRPRGSCAARSSRAVISVSFIVCEEPLERGLRQQQAQEHPQQAIEPRRAQLLRRGRLSAAAPRTPAAIRASRRSARAAAGTACGRRRAARRACSTQRRRGGCGPVAGGRGLCARRGPWRRSRRGSAASRSEPGEVGQLGGGDQRQRDRRRAATAPRPPRRRRRAAGSSGR